MLALMPPDEQNEYPTDYFRSPLGIPLVLSGNFAEMREGHFHGGLDVKTRESEGYRVYAAADGYIARVKVSPYGYGNALYVAHPNGYTTVYAHLSRFKGEIASYVRRTQYDRKSFAIDRYPEPGRYPVKKGEAIALSGNSGSSSGPHLHFEVRTTRDQVPVNPLLFGFEIDDSRVPRIFRIRIYPADDESGVIHLDQVVGRVELHQERELGQVRLDQLRLVDDRRREEPELQEQRDDLRRIADEVGERSLHGGTRSQTIQRAIPGH